MLGTKKHRGVVGENNRNRNEKAKEITQTGDVDKLPTTKSYSMKIQKKKIVTKQPKKLGTKRRKH